MKACYPSISQRVFSPKGFFPFTLWFTKKLINKIGSLGKKYWYQLRRTYPWEPYKMGFIHHSRPELNAIRDTIENLMKQECIPIHIEKAEFEDYLREWEKIIAPYDTCYKKALEYYLTLKLIDFKPTDVYMDI